MNAKPPRDDGDLNPALDVVMAWGPEQSRPILTRMKERFPERPEQELAALIALCEAIGQHGVQLATEIGDSGLAREQAMRELFERWPALDNDHAWRALWQGFYSYWRDNGRFPEEPPPKKRRRRK